MRFQPIDDAVRAEARDLFEMTELSTRAIGEKLGVSHAMIARMAKQGAWRRPFRPGAFRSGALPAGKAIHLKQNLLDRLWGAAARELSDIEVSLAGNARSPATRAEDRKGLALIAKVLREMQAFERELRADTPAEEEEPEDIEVMRNRIADKLMHLHDERLAREAAEAARASPVIGGLDLPIPMP